MMSTSPRIFCLRCTRSLPLTPHLEVGGISRPLGQDSRWALAAEGFMSGGRVEYLHLHHPYHRGLGEPDG